LNNIITIKDVRGYLDKNGLAYLNLEDVSRGLGFIENKDGKEYVMWRRIDKHLSELSFGTCAENKFIPENIFYKLCFKANNAIAKKFQNVVCDEILPTIRKTGTYSIDLYQKKSTSIGEVTNLIKTLRAVALIIPRTFLTGFKKKVKERFHGRWKTMP